jgi:hypothetical protein
MYANLHTLTATPTLSQDGLDDLQLQIFTGKPSRAVAIEAIVAARKKAEKWQVMLMELTQNEEIWDYILAAYCLSIVWKQSK